MLTKIYRCPFDFGVVTYAVVQSLARSGLSPLHTVLSGIHRYFFFIIIINKRHRSIFLFHFSDYARAISVAVGSSNLNDENATVIYARELIKHESYDRRTSDYDIALIRVSGSF